MWYLADNLQIVHEVDRISVQDRIGKAANVRKAESMYLLDLYKRFAVH